jgi:hypothetical protein
MKSNPNTRRETVLFDGHLYSKMLERCVADNIKVYYFVNRAIAKALGLEIPDYLKEASVKSILKKGGGATTDRKEGGNTKRKTMLFDRTLYQKMINSCIDQDLKIYEYLNIIIAEDLGLQPPKNLNHKSEN